MALSSQLCFVVLKYLGKLREEFCTTLIILTGDSKMTKFPVIRNGFPQASQESETPKRIFAAHALVHEVIPHRLLVKRVPNVGQKLVPIHINLTREWLDLYIFDLARLRHSGSSVWSRTSISTSATLARRAPCVILTGILHSCHSS